VDGNYGEHHAISIDRGLGAVSLYTVVRIRMLGDDCSGADDRDHMWNNRLTNLAES